MTETDQAALAASTAQGWAYALNTVARPAPEHVEAAQEALTALNRFGPGGRWAGVSDTLKEALDAARLRVDGGRPDVTVAQLVAAVAELRDAGVIPVPAVLRAVEVDGFRTLQDRAADRVAELEQELDDTLDRATAAEADARRQSELRDRFEHQARQARDETKAAHAGHSAGIAAAREDSRRAGYLWTLAQLGNSAPGYADMTADQLREVATTRLGQVLQDGAKLRKVAKELVRVGGLLSRGLDVGPFILDQEAPLQLAATVARLALDATKARSAAFARQRELEDALDELRDDGGPALAAARAERDMLTKARDAQAAELRQLREERDDVEAELKRWTDTALELTYALEPGPRLIQDSAPLRAELAARVRRQLDRVSAIGERLGREEQISAEQRRRAEAAERRITELEAEAAQVRRAAQGTGMAER
jgi:hypothetical protein